MKYYMLFDWEKKDIDFIPQKIGIPLVMRFSKNGGNRFHSWLNACWSILNESKAGDCIICWFDLQGIMLYWLSLLTFRKRNICCINIMLKDKKSLKNKIATFCYRIALKSPRVRFSVTSEKYGIWLQKKLNEKLKPYIIRDVFREVYTLDKPIKEKDQVFIGGVNGRDWKFVFDLARKMNDVNFCVIVNHNVFETYKDSISSNVELHENVPLSFFEAKMCESKITCLPLNTEAPSGLIVLFRAAANNKMVIITKTAASAAYVNETRGCCLENDLECWEKSIRFHLKETSITKQKAYKLHEFLKDECNEECFVEALKKMLF